ncbi:MAG: hypothetical protein AB7H92_14040 [Microbacteriaceae bacterium]
MGFELPKTTTAVEFAESSPYKGAEVILSLDSSLDDAFRMEQVAAGEDRNRVFETVGEVLVSWNLEHDGEPIPCSVEELRKLPMPFVIEVFKGFQRAMAKVVSVEDPFGS